MKPDMSVSLAFCSVLGREDVQYVVKSLVSIFQANGNILQFIDKLMDFEIAQTSEISSNFLLKHIQVLKQLCFEEIPSRQES